MISRRSLLAGAAGAGALTAFGLRQALPADAAPTSGRIVGFTVINQTDANITPMSEFQADIQRVIDLGGNAVRLGFPVYLAGGVFNGVWKTMGTGMQQVLAQLQYARSRGLAVCLNLACPTADPNDRSLRKTLEVNKAAYDVIGRTLGPYVDGWQVYNEWNTSHYFTHQSLQQPLGSDYLAEVRAHFDALAPVLRAAAPKALVTSAVGGYPSDQKMWLHWENLYSQVGGSLDSWGVVAYPDPSVPSQWSQQAEWIAHMRSTSGKPVTVVETGMCTPSDFMANQAIKAVPGMIRGMAAGAPLAQFVYELRDINTWSSDGQQRFGVYTTDGVRKAHWQATRDAIVAITQG